MAIIDGLKGTQGDVNECVWMLTEAVAILVRESPPRQSAHIGLMRELLSRLEEKAVVFKNERVEDLLKLAQQGL